MLSGLSLRRLSAVVAVALVALVLPMSVSPAPAVPAPGGDGPAYQQTKHLTRSLTFVGETFEADSRDVTVTASRTTQLRGRERINISWTGAHPSGGRAASPFGELGMSQEYPVVILQCRGLDDPSLPPAQQLSPQTCWTSSRMQRSQSVDETAAVWRHDAFATEANRAAKSGLAPIPPECADAPTLSTHITPFVSAKGVAHPSCSAETMAPEAAVGAAFPPAEMAAFTENDGTGSVKFEVRSDIENESLGCNDKVRCSIVVIPIQGITCIDEDVECNKAGRFLSGSSNFANEGVDPTVSPLYWWSESNWRGRFSIPLTFGLPPDACNVLDSRAPTGFYGSELMAQASLQWSPAFCLNKKRFKFQHNKMSDEAGFNLAETGGGAAAFVSSKHETKGTDPVEYAPTAVTGFSVAYSIDRPSNAGEYTDLRLNARLLAKLLTQSYLASERGRTHPGMSKNPVSINLDPEFQALNPGLDTTAREAAATVLSLSESSDVIQTLTSYIAGDKEAMDFINGKPDKWGMAVNPSYKKIKLPISEWPLLDDFVAPSEQECYKENPAPYFTQVAAPINSLRKIAEAVLDAWPNVQTKCDRATSTDPWKIGRIDRQGIGTRFMLGIVSMGDAERLGLTQAKLQTGSSFAEADVNGLARALKTATPSKSGTEPFDLDMAKVVKAGGYPGTMVVYTAARTANLPKEDAAKVAEFIKVSTTEGQRAGFDNGQLPPGYLPISKTGVTSALFKQAQTVAADVAAQNGKVPGDGEDGDKNGNGDNDGTSPSTSTSTTDTSSTTSVPDSLPGTDPVPSANPTDTGKTPTKDKGKDEEDKPVTMPPTQGVSSTVAARLIPLMILIGIGAALLTSVWRIKRQGTRS